MRITFLVALMLLVISKANAQIAQKLKGLITDKETHVPLSEVNVFVTNEKSTYRATTDENGFYTIENVEIGKYNITFDKDNYKTISFNNILVTSAKETYVNGELEERVIKQKSAVISAKKKTTNEMAVVSNKQFDVQETERYAGSRGDPARMASNFAGVQGADDSRNDIVVRGNSPQGVLWRVEDLDIPNPNHFNVPGTTGGPISMLNNKMLANSEFFTGAFPSDFGNSTAAAFDLKLRNGNKDKYEFTGQFGILGTELSAEGPLSKKSGATFLVNYRYSTFVLFNLLNIKIGTNSVPKYQDGSFKLNFPLSKNTKLSFWGIGGLSTIDLIVSNQTTPPAELYGENDRDQYFTSNTGMIGMSLQHNINANTYIKFSNGYTNNMIKADHFKVFRDSNYNVILPLKDILKYKYSTRALVSHWYLNKKINSKNIFRIGIINNLYLLNLLDSSRQYPPTKTTWDHRNDYIGSTDLLQAYAQYKYKPNDNTTVTAGIHTQYLTHNSSFAIEPRLGVKYTANVKSSFSFGYGLHSQMQQMYQYFAHLPQNNSTQLHNVNLGFTKSHHLVLAHDYKLNKIWNLRTEAYYQYLFNIPIETRVGSSYSNVNQGGSFSRLFPDTLVNKGTGYNYGLEMSLARAFDKGYYMLFTGTLYNSLAKGNDGIYRNTDYNGKFITNIVAGREYKIRKSNTLIIGGKITYAGGQLYSPPDSAASNLLGDLVVIDSLRNTLQFPNYFRADLKLGYRINRPRVTHEIAIDLVNVLGTKNLLSLVYSPDLALQGIDPFYKSYQLGFLPLFYYRADFSWEGRK